ncbi:MAG: xanthine dehydrogenase family protein subunit M [Bacteroidota bacterium]
MIPSSFSYTRANSVAEAIELLQKHGDDAKLLAGGQSLIPTLKLRLNEVDTIIDISHLEEIKGISEADSHIVIGAGATHADIVHSELIQSKASLLSEGAEWIGDVQVRNAGTIGGSVVHADPAADWPGLLMAADATFMLQSASGTREVAAADFYVAMYTTAIEDGEVLTQIKVPVPAAGTKSTYQKFMQPASRFAIVGVAVQLTHSDGKCSQVRVAINGVSAVPYRATAVEQAMEGQPCDEGSLAAAAAKAVEGVSVMSDHFADANYRSQMAQVYTKRALAATI